MSEQDKEKVIEEQKQIIKYAVKYFYEMMESSKTDITGSRLEAMSFDKDSNRWVMKVSYKEKVPENSFDIFGDDRIYKIITMDRDGANPSIAETD